MFEVYTRKRMTPNTEDIPFFFINSKENDDSPTHAESIKSFPDLSLPSVWKRINSGFVSLESPTQNTARATTSRPLLNYHDETWRKEKRKNVFLRVQTINLYYSKHVFPSTDEERDEVGW